MSSFNNKTPADLKRFSITGNYATLLENENDLDALVAERLKPKPNISINGLKLSEEASHKLEAEVQDIVARVLKRSPPATLQEKPTSKSSLPLTDEAGKMNISSNVYGLSDEDNEEIVREIEPMIQRFRDRGEIIDDTTSANEGEIIDDTTSGIVPLNQCITVSGPRRTGQVGLVPDWRTINKPLPHVYGLLWLEDTIVMRVIPRPGLLPNRVAVKLEAASHTDADGNVIPEITWGKMILAWNYRRNTGVDTISVNMGSIGVGPIERIVSTGCNFTNTLIFIKQKFLGHWTEMYTLAIAGVPEPMQSEEFSKAFGGKELHFTWKLDNVYNGSVGNFSL